MGDESESDFLEFTDEVPVMDDGDLRGGQVLVNPDALPPVGVATPMPPPPPVAKPGPANP